MTHVMLDLETWGTKPGAAIRAETQAKAIAAAFRTKQFSPR